ncbi:MAG: response regulator [Candidatus Hydrogenedentes bacterium]|nr:response regulator [Candidatus Hydrogenedentota bacterium]
MPEPLRILLVEDDDDHAALIRRHLTGPNRAAVTVQRAACLKEALLWLREGGIDAILLDLGLPDSGAEETLTRVLQESAHVPVIVLTALNDRDLALRAVQQGAQDFLVKSQLSSDLLLRSVQYAVERKRAQEQLRRLNKTLEQRVAERTQMLEHRTAQLRALASELTLSEQRERRRLSTELHDYLAQMLVACKLKLTELDRMAKAAGRGDQTEQMREMLDDSLDYTRTLIAELSPSILYVAGLTSAVGWLGEQMKRQHELTVHLQADGEYSDMPEDTAVLIYQTIRELLFNVVKHADVSEATVELSRMGDTLSVVVSDEGKGFGAPLSTSSALSGRFGLFNVQERLEAMGGQFAIESYPGRGSRVSFHLKLWPAREPALPPPPEPFQAATRPIGVLVVDDHKMVREGLRRMIRRFGNIEVVGEAENGEEAVELARSLRPDAIIMDINMPRMNGLEATRLIKRELPVVTVIGHSVHDDRDVLDSLRQAGINSYVMKGGSANDLYRALSTTWTGDGG